MQSGAAAEQRERAVGVERAPVAGDGVRAAVDRAERDRGRARDPCSSRSRTSVWTASTPTSPSRARLASPSARRTRVCGPRRNRAVVALAGRGGRAATPKPTRLARAERVVERASCRATAARPSAARSPSRPSCGCAAATRGRRARRARPRASSARAMRRIEHVADDLEHARRARARWWRRSCRRRCGRVRAARWCRRPRTRCSPGAPRSRARVGW